jgi:hypothetical protein
MEISGPSDAVCGKLSTVTVSVLDARVQLRRSVTVTEYCPACVIVIAEVVAPLLHANVYCDGLKFVFHTTELPAHIDVVLPGYGDKLPGYVTCIMSEDVKPKISVTVTEYVPLLLTIIESVVAPVLQ